MTERPDAASLYRMLAWLSPAYPTGAFSYSHGLEMAVEDGLVTDRAGLVAYVATVLRAGAGRVDAALLAIAWRAASAGDDAALDEAATLAAAWRGTAETALETMQQGTAFAARHPRRLAHPVAFAAAAAFHGVPLRPALTGWLGAFAANLVSAGVRLVPLGQTDGQIATAALHPLVDAAADAALTADPDTLGTAAPLLDPLSMRHETQYTRRFRS